ncbi:MAG: flagellin [Fibrobacterota bacterium]
MPRINHNIPAMITANTLMRTERELSLSIERLSTGQKINTAYDDAAGYSVSEQLRLETRNLSMGSQNIQNGKSLLDIVNGGLTEIESIVNRMRELAVKSANGSLTDEDRQHIQDETDQLISEVDRVAGSTEFNGNPLIDGSAPWGSAQGGKLHIGSGYDTSSDIFYIRLQSMKTDDTGLGIGPAAADPIDLTTSASAQESISKLDSAIQTINSQLANVGAYGNRLEHALNNQESMKLNMTAADTIIRDTDMAEESAKRAQLSVLQNAGINVLAQANSFPKEIMTLLKV